MVGITSYGAYIPFYRLDRKLIDQAWGVGAARGEKAVAYFDEDSLTMAVDAGRDCRKGLNGAGIDGLFFATTTSPYGEKLSATLAATAMDLPRQIRTADFTDSLRAGTIAFSSAVDAVKAGSIKSALVVAADCRLGSIGSEFDQLLGDGAAALTVGDSGVIASIENSYSLADEILDVWRLPDDTFLRTWEDRWVEDVGYSRVAREGISGFLKKAGLTPKDFSKVAAYGHNARTHARVLGALGFAPEQIQDPLFGTVGHTGAAQALLTLVAALETAKPGDKILLASYGDGFDAFVLQVTDEILKFQKRNSVKGVKGYLAIKAMMSNYNKYLRWREFVRVERARRPPPNEPSATVRFRERERIDALHAQKCKQCGTVVYHDMQTIRVCFNCHSKDQFEDWSLADKKAKVASFSLDYLGAGIDPPTMFTVLDFDGGGRMTCDATSCAASEIKVGLEMEMCFRRLNLAGGVNNYFWKSRPIR